MVTRMSTSQAKRAGSPIQRPAFLGCVATAIIASTSAPALADDRDRIPNEIAVRQFEVYLDSLAPTRSQFVESVSLYKTYLNDFNHLRATAIEPQLAKRVTANDLPGMVRQFKGLNRKVSLVRRKATRLDSSLFDSLQELLSVEQLEDLQRARRHRLRQIAPIYAFFESTGREFTDLSDVAVRIEELSDDDQAVLDTVFSSYEQRLTAIVRQLTRNVPDIQGDVLAGLLEQNYDLDSEGFAQAYDDLRTAITAPSLKLAQVVDELNARTSRSIESLLSDSGVGAWRLASIKAMYPDAEFIVRAELNAKNVKEQLVDFTDDDRAILEYQLSETIRHLRDTLETLVTADNTMNARHPAYLPGFGAVVQAYYEARSAARRSVSDRLKEQQERFKTQLSDDGFARWTKTSASVWRSSRSTKSQMVEAEELGHASTSFVPIVQKDLNHYKTLLTLNDIQVNAIKAVFDMYLPRARAVVTAAHHDRDPEEHRFNWLPSDRSMRALTDLDASIFDLLGTTTSTVNHNTYLESIQAIRRRQLLTHKTALSGAGEVDFANVLYYSGLSNDALRTLDDLLEEYNPSADSLFKARFGAYKTIIDLEASEGSQSDISQAREARSALQRQLARLNLATVKRALELLSPEDRADLERAFDNAAFGRVLRDPLVADRFILQATQLRDMDQQQSESIATVQEEYQDSYRKLTRTIVETLDDNIFWSVDENQELWPIGSNTQRDTLQRLRFERRQLNELVRLTLRTILSKEQFKLISG